ncbi:MAG: amino acid ABC transporter ATP-binding protein [Lachnospiraceae bacterium]
MAILEIKELKKSFDNTEVLKGINFSLEKGEVLAIIGSSGSGKTTLLRCLNFLELADSGLIEVNGKTVFDGSDPHYATDSAIRENCLHFGLVFQSFNLFPQYTVLGNLTLAPRLAAKSQNPDYRKRKASIFEEIDQQALALLDRVGLLQKKDAYPCELSGGQQQRVAIARALMYHPEILCFDEPTSALDPELTKEVLRVIRSLKNNENTMIVVTHEMDFARNVADKVIFMADGIIEEMGSSDDVFTHPKSPVLQAFLHNALDFKQE